MDEKRHGGGQRGTKELVHIVRRSYRRCVGRDDDTHPLPPSSTRTLERIHELCGRFSRSLHPPSHCGNPPRHPEGRVVSLYLPLIRPPQLSPPSLLPHPCMFILYFTVHTYVYVTLVTRVTRIPTYLPPSLPPLSLPFSRIRATCSLLYGAHRRKYINRSHSRRYRQLLLPPSSRR